jgi:hypothetical protein
MKSQKKGFKAAGPKPAKRRAVSDEMAEMNPRAPQGMGMEAPDGDDPQAMIGTLVTKLAAAGMSPEMIMQKLQELFGGGEGMGAPPQQMPSPGMGAPDIGA